MNRIDRISAILIQLQSRRTVRAQDIAERFNISLRTVYRDVKTLEEAGIPLVGEAGIGYSIVDGYRLPPVMFTRDEAAAFLTAEKMVNRLTDAANSASFSSAMYKVRAVLKSTEKDYLERIEQNIEVVKGKSQRLPDSFKIDNQLQTILTAVAHKELLLLDYKAAFKEPVRNRNVEPVGVFYLDGYWHLIAWCRLRNDYRDFRFDRMEKLNVTGNRFATNHAPLEMHLRNLYHDAELTAITIRIKKAYAIYVGNEKYYHGFVSETEKDDLVEMNFMSPSLEGFARWVIIFGDCITYAEPPRLKERIKSISKEILKNLG